MFQQQDLHDEIGAKEAEIQSLSIRLQVGIPSIHVQSTVWWNVVMAFLHNRAAESHEILSECSHQ